MVHIQIELTFCVMFVSLHLWKRFFFLLNAAKSEITFGKVSIFPRMFWNLTLFALNKGIVTPYKSGHRGRWNGTSWLPSWVSEKQLYISFNFFDQEALLIYVISLSLYHTYLYVQSCWHVQVTFASLGNRFIGSMKSGFLITAISEAIKVGRFCLPTSAFCTKQCFLNFCEKYGHLHTINQK